MKNLTLLIAALFLCSFTHVKNEPGKLPNVSIKNLNRKVIHTCELKFDTPVIVCFWSATDPSSIKMLNSLQDEYANNGKENEVKIIAISTDNNAWDVRSLVLFSGWNFDIYVDPNKDLWRAMGGGSSPCILVINDHGETTYKSVNAEQSSNAELLYAVNN